jgi:hypothetical protein
MCETVEMPSEYFGRVRKIWTKNIAGPAAAVCAIVLPIAGVSLNFSPVVNTWLGVAPLLIAVLLTWPAHYEVWKEDRERREKDVVEERPKPEAPEADSSRPGIRSQPETRSQSDIQVGPEIQGELRGFRLSGRPGESRTGNVWRCYANAACKLYICSSKPTKVTLKELIIDGSALDPPAEFTQVTFLKGGDQVLEQGIGVDCDLLLNYTFKGLQWKQIGRVDLKTVKVYAVDSSGNKHLISVSQGESLPTP